MIEKATIEKLLEFIDSKKAYLDYAYKMYDIFNKNLSPYVYDRLITNFKSEQSRHEASTRLAPINILPKLVNKLSKVYNTAEVEVSADNERSLETVESFFKKDYREKANLLLNLHSCCALEPVFSGEEGFVRVLPAQDFLVYSDDPVNPSRVTHFIKIISTDRKKSDCIYHIYTADYWIEIDGEGTVIQEMENSYGEIPFVYLSRDSMELLPRNGRDDYEMVTLLPLLLTDMNFALKYKAYSILYVLNAEAPSLNLAPNAVWSFKSEGYEGDKVEINQITPTLAVDEVLKNITTQYSMWLETKNLKSPSFFGGSHSTQGLSGVAKIIDEADVTDDIAKQRSIMKEAEEKLYPLLSKTLLLNKGTITDLSKVEVNFVSKELVPETPKDKVERVIAKVSNKLVSWDDAISEINSIKNKELVEAKKQEIQEQFEEWQNGLQSDNAVQAQNSQESSTLS